MGVVHVLANLTSRSPLLMTEVQKLGFILDSNDISIRARYIKTTSNIWANRLSREIDYGNWAFSLHHFNHLDNIWGVTPSNASLPWRTRRSRPTIPAGVTLAARPPTTCASPMAHGVVSTTGATPPSMGPH
eukprot:jgi/Tetstr1/457826/TSEL_044371.t1